MHEQPRRRGTRLSVTQEEVLRVRLDGVFNVGILENNRGRLATKFKGDVLHVALSRSNLDLATGCCGASEGNLINAHVGR